MGKKKKGQNKYLKNTGQHRTHDLKFVRMGYKLVKYVVEFGCHV